MKNKLIFILWLLMFSFFSCDFGLKENEETNSKEYFTVKGSCSIQGAIPSELFPKKTIKQNAQRTVVPEKIDPNFITVIFESETGETKSVDVVNKEGVLNFEIELPAGKWTVKAQGKKDDVVIIKSESCQIELSAENKSANVELVLKPTQSDTERGYFKFSFGEKHYTVSGMKYTYKKNGATDSDSAIINNFTAEENISLSSGVYTFRFDFYRNMECNGELLYSFTEVVNIFDGLTTDTWIGAGEYIEDGKICITDTMISQFVSTTVYVDENGNDSNLGTFFAPVRTIQKAVNKVIDMNVVTEPEEGKPYKIFLLSDIISDNSSENNNNALVNIDPSSPLSLTISKYGDGAGNATINAKRTDSNTGRVMYIGEKANVTLENLILTGGYLKNDENKNGGGIYSKGICNLNYCTISGNTAKASGGSVKGGGVYIESGSFTMKGCTISGNTAGSETDNANAYGGGIFGASGTNITMNDTIISENKVASVNEVDGAGVYFSGAGLTMDGGLINKNKCYSDYSSYGGGVYINNSSTFTMTSGEISKNSAEYGGGVYVSGGNFIMNGGSISNNTVTENGKGVHVVKSNNIDSLFEISGDASITEDNDVYLAKDQKITITGDLSSEIVATITPENYAEDEDVPVLATDNDITLNDQLVSKFEVTKYSDNVETIITAITEDKGCLKNTLTLGENAVLTEVLYNICSTINVTSADGMKAISNLSQTENGEKDFKGKTINLKAHVVLDDEYKPIHTFSGVFDGKDHTITLTKPINYGYFTNFYLGGAIFNVITGEEAEKAEVRNLDVYGEAYIAGIAMELKNDAVISNCNNYATITSPNGPNVHGCGGIVGELSDGGVIINCKNEGTITYNSTNDKGCGGIVGEISGNYIDKENSIIANCINNKEIKRIQVQIENMDDQKASIGGICGKVTGKAAIYNCVNTQYGSVTSLTDQNVTEYIGGITGYCSVSFYDEDYTYLPADMGIFNCYNSGSISCTNNSGSKYVGGIVGQGHVAFSNWVYHTIRVTNTVNNDDATFSIGNIINSGSSVGSDITNNYYKFAGTSPYGSYFNNNNMNSVVSILNNYSDRNGRRYLQWCVEDDGSSNIIFSEEIIGNQEITP